jgi:hypothetical protein
MSSCTFLASTESQILLTPDEFNTRLGKLAERWKTHSESDLKIRHDAGSLLNARFGSPEKRQKQGEKVLKEAAEQLGTAESELSRMRWFAHHFKTPDDLSQRYSEAKTWSAVKDLLPSLRPGKKTSDGDKGRKAIAALKSSLTKLTSKLKESLKDLSSDERKDLQERCQDFAKTIGDCLAQESVNQLSEEETPPAALTAEG